MPERQPPGRAGRLWLLARLESARRGAELLDRKRQLLRNELRLLGARREETRRDWEAAWAAAERTGRLATSLGGTADVALAAAAVSGRSWVTVPWRNTMGVIHPGEPVCTLATLPPADAAAANAAVAPAAAAHRRALAAAASYAAAEASFDALDAERRATERHLRAIESRRIPALEEAERLLALHLEELEREERVTTRWAKQRRDAEASAAGLRVKSS